MPASNHARTHAQNICHKTYVVNSLRGETGLNLLNPELKWGGTLGRTCQVAALHVTCLPGHAHLHAVRPYKHVTANVVLVDAGF